MIRDSLILELLRRELETATDLNDNIYKLAAIILELEEGPYLDKNKKWRPNPYGNKYLPNNRRGFIG